MAFQDSEDTNIANLLLSGKRKRGPGERILKFLGEGMAVKILNRIRGVHVCMLTLSPLCLCLFID